jgi:nicotinamide-nucleotide amidase
LSAEITLSISPALCERAQAILTALKTAEMSIVTAESCTAGIVAAVLSRMQGASEVLHGGFVTYTKAHKTAALGVSADLLREKGAVNGKVVEQLAAGALKNSPASLSLAVSGVLGPEEDEDGNPVGLVYFCCQKKNGLPVVVRDEFGKKRPEELLRLIINRAFDLIESCIKGSYCESGRTNLHRNG